MHRDCLFEQSSTLIIESVISDDTYSLLTFSYHSIKDRSQTISLTIFDY